MNDKKVRNITQKKCGTKKLKIEHHKEKDAEDSNNSGFYHDQKDIEDLGTEPNIWEPDNWEEVLNNIREMRKKKDAPVDLMGCDKCADETSKPEIKRFHTLVALMLSSQTKDEVTFAAMEQLKNYKTGLNIDSILEMPDNILGELIYPVGFWKKKTKYLKDTAKILKEKFNGDIPNTVNLLCTLPGVGQKMAHLCMKTAWGVISGIGVDTHVHRISNRLGWVRIPTKSPEQTRTALESWIPNDLWEEVNHLLVGFGQQTCKPVKPLCNICLNHLICPFAKKNLK